MIFQLYDPSLVFLKDFFFFYHFIYSPFLSISKTLFLTELIPSCLVAAGFHYSAIALVGHLIKLHQLCFSGCTFLPSLIPIVPEMRESGKFIAPPSHRPGFNINFSEITFSTFSLKILYY